MKNDFLFGVAASSLQIEGTNSKFKTIWDLPNNKILDKSNCDLACKFSEKYIEDIKSLKELGVDVFRMSISWARICPAEGSFSKEGIKFYHNVFKELRKSNILIDVTLYHWDMPLWLYEKGIGFHSKEIISYFLEYSKRMFHEYDQYINNWATLNEPWCISRVGYVYGTHAPFIENDLQKAIQTDYYMLITHKEVYNYYKANYQGSIGIVLNVWGSYPLTDSIKDIEACESCHQFYEGVYLNPLFKGQYSELWLKTLKSLELDLSFINAEELRTVKDTTDYLGINYYMHNTVTYDESELFKFKCVQTDFPHTDMGWEINPEGLKNVIKQIRERYTDLPIYITENGSAFKDEVIDGLISDVDRIDYLNKHFNIVEEIHEELNIKGYYLWSLMDNFEWHFGYTKRFGIIYIDYNDYKRIYKNSFYEYQKIIKEKRNK